MRYITTVLMLPWYQVLAGVSQCAVRYTTAQTCQGGDGRKLLNILENTHINFLSVLLVDCSVLQASFILYKYGKRTVFSSSWGQDWPGLFFYCPRPPEKRSYADANVIMHVNICKAHALCSRQCVCVCVCVCVWMCVHARVCVRERQTDRETHRNNVCFVLTYWFQLVWHQCLNNITM